MEKIRVYELAKKLGISSKEVITALKDLDIPVKNHMSSMEKETAALLEDLLSKEKGKPAAGKAGEKGKPAPGKAGEKGAGTGRPGEKGKEKAEEADKKTSKPRDREAGKGKEDPKKSLEKGRKKAPEKPQAKEAKAGEAKAKKEDIKKVDTKKVDTKKEEKKKEDKPSAEVTRKKEKKKKTRGKSLSRKGAAGKVEKVKVTINLPITVKELAEEFKVNPTELITRLLVMGVAANINQQLEAGAIKKVAGEFGFEAEVLEPQVPQGEELLEEEEERPEDLRSRPPVVTVLGHVDHGKTSLLDAVRKTDVTSQEAGGITQHIGAHEVDIQGRKIVFLDTPGHEAFTAMRARGAQVTDIAVLVIAADDGVMPQTVEAINHVRAAEVPIIVALNKIDKPEANPDRVKQQLTEYGLVPEEWGGDIVCVPVSAKNKEGLDNLLEMILLVAEMAELKANPSTRARGTIVEAKLDRGRGPVATALIQKGTLKVGDSLVCGSIYGRVRAMINHKGQKVKKAIPSQAVEVLGFPEVPEAGDVFQSVKDEKIGRQVADKRGLIKRDARLHRTRRLSLDDLYRQIKEGEVKELKLIIKGDVQGSIEALKDSLDRLGTTEVRLQVIHSGVGTITESDVMLASASNAIIIGFNVRPEASARKMAEIENIDIKLYRVIYEAIEDIKLAMTGLLDPVYREVTLGRAEIRQIFRASRLGVIAGCYVLEGKAPRDSSARLIRDGVVVHEGKVGSLKRFKDDVKEVQEGYECGLMLEKYQDLKEGDIVEFYGFEVVKPA